MLKHCQKYQTLLNNSMFMLQTQTLYNDEGIGSFKWKIDVQRLESVILNSTPLDKKGGNEQTISN